MRVLQLISDTDRRGAQLFAVALESQMRALGVDVRTHALVPGGAESRLDVEPLTDTVRWQSALPALRRRSRDADVVVAHGSTTLPAAGLSLGGALFVYRSIGDLPQWVVTPRQKLTTAVALKRAAAVTALWPAVASTIVDDFGVDVDRVHVLPNAADHRRFVPPVDAERQAARTTLGIAADDDVIAYVGALTDEKRVERILAAVAGRTNTTVVIAGDGPRRADLVAAAAGLDGVTVRFLGAVEDPLPVYWAADVLAMASRTEGQPGVIIEAGLTGLASVSTAVGGVGSLIDDTVTGRLVAADDPASLNAALRAALDEVLRESDRYGHRALVHCRANFAIERAAQDWVKLLEQVIRRGPR